MTELRVHECNANLCYIKTVHFMCRKHWVMLSENLRSDILATKFGTPAWILAAGKAINLIATAEGRTRYDQQ